MVPPRRCIVGIRHIRMNAGGIVGKCGRDGSCVHIVALALAVAAFGRDAGSLEEVGRQVARVALLKGALAQPWLRRHNPDEAVGCALLGGNSSSNEQVTHAAAVKGGNLTVAAAYLAQRK